MFLQEYIVVYSKKTILCSKSQIALRKQQRGINSEEKGRNVTHRHLGTHIFKALLFTSTWWNIAKTIKLNTQCLYSLLQEAILVILIKDAVFSRLYVLCDLYKPKVLKLNLNP